MLHLFGKIMKWRSSNFFVLMDEVKFQWTNLHLSIVRDYYSSFSRICDFQEPPFTISYLHNLWSAAELRSAEFPSSRMFAKIAASFTQGLQQLFMVPRLDKFHQSNNRIKKYQLVEACLSFLLQLLYHERVLIFYSCDYRIDDVEILEKELRFLHTILGDMSLMQLDDEHEEFQELLAEFEAVANQAGRLVHSLFFSIDGVFQKTNERIGVILNHIDLLKANIMKFLNLLPSMRRSACITPKTSVMDTFLIVDSLIFNLEDLMKQEDKRIVDLKEQIKLLHQGLIFLQSSIEDMRSPQTLEIGELKGALMGIGDVAHEAESLIISFLVGDAPLWYLINRLNNVNRKIELIGTEIQKLKEIYKFGVLKVAKYFSTQPSVQGTRNTQADDVTVGFEGVAKDILGQLVGGGTEHLQVISIFGMAGIGKTTLAKKLYNNSSVKYWFDKLSWCVVSQAYQSQSILANILIDIESEQDKNRILKMEEESLIEKIYKALKGRRYLIVMDDIWDSNVWNNLRRCFPDDGNGSRILFTNRNMDVVPPYSRMYKLPFLSNEQCWELLEKKVFDNRPCPSELLGIGKKIAANCRGLPIAVVVIAGILSTVDKETSTWEEVGENLASYILDGGDNSVMQILELSYKHLPDRLKPCFLYFGAFREDKEIPVGKLMRLWIAEGFIHKEEEKAAENVAEEYFMELIEKNLVIVAKRRLDGTVKTCVVHDLLRDLCLKRSKEENFLTLLDDITYSKYEKSHRLQALNDTKRSSSYFQHVRSFHGRNVHSRTFYVRDMRLLRVLHFDRVMSHFTGVEYLVYLRYLVIGQLSASICRLVNLEFLRVDTIKPVLLHSGIMKMKKLRHIHVGSCAIYCTDCNSSETNNLEFLSRVIICDLKDEEMLKCSPYLRKLKCAYEMRSMEKKACPHFDLRFLTHLESLNLTFCRHEIVLEEYRFPSNIRKLTLALSGWPWEKMSIIGRLENLEVLNLGSGAFIGERWDTREGEFQKLRVLTLSRTDLSEWNVTMSEHFPGLKVLLLADCYNLKEIPSEIGEIATLELVGVLGRCQESLVESAKRIKQEQWSNGNEELSFLIAPFDFT